MTGRFVGAASRPLTGRPLFSKDICLQDDFTGIGEYSVSV